MEPKNNTVNPFPLFSADDDPILTGLRLGNWMWRAVNAPSLSEQDVPEPLPNSRTLKLVKGAK